jgi:hypothetical protein
LHLALALGVWAVLLLVARLGTGAVACWLWPSGLGMIAAAFLPGVSPYFVFPSLVAAAVLPFAATRRALLLVPALAALIVWTGLLVQGEELLGLAAHPLFTVPAAFALMALAPLLPPLRRHAWIAPGVPAAVLAVVAGFLPPYSAARPQRLNLHYVEEGGRAWWAADAVRPFPAALRAAGHFSTQPRSIPASGNFFVAPAGRARFPAPSADVARKGDRVRVRLHGSSAADILSLGTPKSARPVSAAIGGWTFAPRSSAGLTVSCATARCRDIEIVLGLKSKAAAQFTLTEQHLGLPPGESGLVAARGPAAVPSQFGDTTMLVAKIAVPGNNPVTHPPLRGRRRHSPG